MEKAVASIEMDTSQKKKKQKKTWNKFGTLSLRWTIWELQLGKGNLNINVFLIKQTIPINWFLALQQKHQKF